MNGLGFNTYTARYLSGVKRASGTFPSVTTPWVLSKFTSDYFTLTNRQVSTCWPLIGGTAGAHALDLFGRFHLTWYGTVTHNSNGVTGNGTDGRGTYDDIKDLIPNINAFTFGAYSRSSITADNKYFIGSSGSASTFYIGGRFVADTSMRATAGNVSVMIMASVASSQGLMWVRRQSSTVAQFVRNTTGTNINTSPATGYPENTKFSICALNDNTYFAAHNLAFAFVIPSFVNDYAEFYNTIQALQTHFGRQV